MENLEGKDDALESVRQTWLDADQGGVRTSRVIRDTFDQLYDGQHTGRYSVDQLSKTEKTHFGSLVEINLRREFDDIISDGVKLDFSIAGAEIDCKFSFTSAWMIPPEAFGELLLVCHASDSAGEWSLGVVRATPDKLRGGANRDAKVGLSASGRARINWIFHRAPLPENVLLHMDSDDRDAVFALKSGQKRVNELFRRAQLVPIRRATVATVAQQDDFMKRVRYNGGARSALQPEGILIAGGDYEAHRSLALQLGAPEPLPGEFVSFSVVPSVPEDPRAALIDGSYWRIPDHGEPVTNAAPTLPSILRPR